MRLLADDPTNLSLLLTTAGILVENHKYKLAIKVLDEGKKETGSLFYQDPLSLFHFKYLLALSFLGLGQEKQGLDLLSDIIEAQSNFSPAYFALSSHYMKKGKVEVAEFILKRGLDFDPQDSSLCSLLAKLFFDKGQTDLALETVDRALVSDSSSVAALTIRAQILIYKGQYDAAEAGLKRALALAPYRSEVLTILGICQNQMGQTDLAFKTLRRASQLNPNDSLARFNLAVLSFTKADRRNEALRLFSEVLALDSGSENVKKAALAYLGRNPG